MGENKTLEPTNWFSAVLLKKDFLIKILVYQIDIKEWDFHHGKLDKLDSKLFENMIIQNDLW